MFLADYFAIIRSDAESQSGCRISCRIPAEDHEHLAFPGGSESFAIPNGWSNTKAHQSPRFHMLTNTKVDGTVYYSVFFTFYTVVKDVEEEYEPTCLMLVSSHSYFQPLKNALFMLFDQHVRRSEDLEKLLAHILAQQVPTPGWKTPVRFNLGDRMTQHAVQAPQSPTIPATGDSIAKLLNYLGPRNLITLVVLLLTDYKIALFGKSFSALAEASRALVALIYPFTYTGTLIPVLPKNLADYLMSPVPFLVGVHTDIWESRRSDCPDVVGCDIDGGKLVIPDNFVVPKLPHLVDKELVHRLTLVAKPALVSADLAFPPKKLAQSPGPVLDKEVRAIFLMTLVRILSNYRSSLQFSRIHPEVQTKLNRQEFLQSADPQDFKVKLSAAQSFQVFVQERGPSFRPLDLFDNLMEDFDEKNPPEFDTQSITLSREVIKVRNEFMVNEMPKWNDRLDLSECMPAELMNFSNGLETFEAESIPDLSDLSVMGQRERLLDGKNQNRFQAEPQTSVRIVHEMQPVSVVELDTESQRHQNVLDEFLRHVEANCITEMRKKIPGACRALQKSFIRARLLETLKNWSEGVMSQDSDPKGLSDAQFYYIQLLLDLTLKNSEKNKDQYHVASSVIAISAELGRKVETEQGAIRQQVMSKLQDHSIWCSFDFWIEYFHIELQCFLTEHYRKSLADDPSIRTSNSVIMRVVADQLAEWQAKTDERKKEIAHEEEGIVYNQLLKLVTYMIPLLVPFTPSKMAVLRRNMRNNQQGADGNSSLYTSSNADPDDEEDDSEDEGFADQPNKIINRFIEKVSDNLCIACNIMNSRAATLGQHVSFEIQRIAEDYDQLSRATARIQKFKRPADLSPKYLENEKVEASISVHLWDDRREFGIFGSYGSSSKDGLRHSDGEVFLPAEGTLYLTNYRILFYGYSRELEHLLVIRSAPITSIIKVKQTTTPSAPRPLSNHRLEIRTATMEFFNVVFTSEATEDRRRKFYDTLMQLRFPEDNSPLSVFAFAKNPKAINKTIQFKTKTGLKDIMHRRKNIGKVGELPTISENITSTLKNKGTLEKFNERSSRNGDFDRLGLTSGSFRLLNTSKLNAPFSLCKTYPGITVQLASITDTTVQGAAKAFKRSRYPAIVWRHSRNGCILARSEAISGSVIHRLLRRRRFDEIDEVGLANPTKDLESWIKAVVSLGNVNLRNKENLQQVSMLQRSSIYASANSVSSSSTLASTGLMGGFRDSIRIPTLQRSRGGSTLPSPKKNSSSFSKLVIFVDKDTRKLKPEVEHQVEFLSIDTPSTDAIRDAFKDLCKNAPSSNGKNHFSFGENSRWYSYVLSALSCASAAADLMHQDSISVYFALEGGWDFTCVLTAIIQLILDPYYRTIDGFRTLVQREFISFGHRFSTNGIQRDYPSPSPFFILFLDCVFQLINQNLCSFEFTQAFLHLTAYHTFSGRFSTFLLDSEHDRIESLIMFDSSPRSCFWNYVQEALQNPKCPLINKFYLPNEEAKPDVLSMTAEMEFIKLFPYLSGLSTTSPHDMDNLLDEFSLDVAEDKDLRQNFLYSGVDNTRAFFNVDQKRVDSFSSESFPSHVLSELKEKNEARINQRVKNGSQFINRCRRLKLAEEADHGTANLGHQPEKSGYNVYEGYLWKKGKQFGGWKGEYFAIVDNKSIVQYESKGGRITKEIPLNQITSAELMPMVDPRSLPRDTRPDFHFQLRTNSRNYNFVAPNAAAAKRWVDAVRESIDC